MNYVILVNEGPYTHQASDSAYNFAHHALAKGHTIRRVFFYYDGVLNGTKYSSPQSDDRHIVRRWSQLAETHAVDLAVCVAAGLRRGISEDVLAPGFRITGLGELIEACIDGGRTLVFGD
jgi:tRNA 2-thiouridine synthesizing protein D